jgi:hypothetical protein
VGPASRLKTLHIDLSGPASHCVSVVPCLHPQQHFHIDAENAFSIRSAISGQRAALPFIRSESVARRTPSASAASLTLKPSSSRISSRMNVPGFCGLIPIFVGAPLISDSPPGRDCRSLPVQDQTLAIIYVRRAAPDLVLVVLRLLPTRAYSGNRRDGGNLLFSHPAQDARGEGSFGRGGGE